MIRVRNLGMRFEQEGEALPVLHDINFEMDKGDSVAIVGPSGSGKTTLLQLLAALEQPTCGEITIDGQSLATLSVDALADFRRDQLGIVFQSFHLIDSLNALGNVSLPLDIQGHADALSRARLMLEEVGLSHRMHHYPRQLSGGEQQRVAIARALVHKPRLVLADEPTGNLDQNTSTAITDLLFGLHAESDATLVLVTHDMRLAERCKRSFWLEEGRLHESR
ncbi:MAG: ABC transporter ATP-binding protein [Oleiphilaceae bacterium]|nr:ABC transporter ATP-binding protein [Oleiphilaceae bacterium]